MATVHQKTLLAGRMPDRLIAGKMHVVPGNYFANWKELKEWLLLSFSKPEQELLKLEKIIRNNSQGNKSFGEYSSNLSLDLKPIKNINTSCSSRRFCCWA